MGVSSMALVGVNAMVGVGKTCALVGLGIAVGTELTGLITFRIYVFATSYRHASRLLMAGI